MRMTSFVHVNTFKKKGSKLVTGFSVSTSADFVSNNQPDFFEGAVVSSQFF